MNTSISATVRGTSRQSDGLHLVNGAARPDFWFAAMGNAATKCNNFENIMGKLALNGYFQCKNHGISGISGKGSWFRKGDRCPLLGFDFCDFCQSSCGRASEHFLMSFIQAVVPHVALNLLTTWVLYAVCYFSAKYTIHSDLHRQKCHVSIDLSVSCPTQMMHWFAPAIPLVDMFFYSRSRVGCQDTQPISKLRDQMPFASQTGPSNGCGPAVSPESRNKALRLGTFQFWTYRSW